MKRPHREPHVLRCHAYAKDGLVYAECIDMSIIVARPTLDQAKEALHEAVNLTLEVAAERGAAEDVLNRPAPLDHQFRYYLAAIRTRFRPLRIGRRPGVRPQPLQFVVSCPVHA